MIFTAEDGNMRIVVVADTHRDYYMLKEVVEDNLDADAFIHLGDGENELRDMEQLFPHKMFYFVQGNRDYASKAKVTDILNLGGKKILITHGHHYDVRETMDNLVNTAEHNDVDIALYGHTHLYSYSCIDGIYVMNPGSLHAPRGRRYRSYGTIDISGDDVAINIIEIKR